MKFALKGLLASVAVVLAAAAPASASVVINEVESDGAVDFVELFNDSSSATNISGFVIKDSDDNNAFTVPAGTFLAANGYYLLETEKAGFGLGKSDAARLYAGGVLIDSYAWTSHAATTYGRCGGQMTVTLSPTP